MGVFTYPLEVDDPRGERFETVDAMVDAGATFTVLPSAQLERLGIQGRRKARFRIANGSVLELNVDKTVVRLGGQTITTPVVFAEEGTPTILGAVALEAALLVVDPIGQKLVPTDGLTQPPFVHERPNRFAPAAFYPHRRTLRFGTCPERCD